jgi:hypothetical protein
MQPGATKSDYVEGFRSQVQYVNHRLIETVDQIQARSKQPPVIVVLSDHGPASGEWLSDLSHPSIIERFGILSALRMPGVTAGDIPEDLSAVNAFRLILNQYFDTRLDMLESKTYYTLEAQPYRYIPIELRANSGSDTRDTTSAANGPSSKATSAVN